MKRAIVYVAVYEHIGDISYLYATSTLNLFLCLMYKSNFVFIDTSVHDYNPSAI